MKILLVTDNRSWAQAMQIALTEHEVLIASQDEALSIFLEFEPEATLVNEYEVAKGLRDQWQKSIRNFEDIRAAATPGQKILCCGFIAQDSPDFLRLPFLPQEFLARIT